MVLLATVIDCGGNKAPDGNVPADAGGGADASLVDAASECVSTHQPAPRWCKTPDGRHLVMPPIDRSKLGKPCKQRLDCDYNLEECVNYESVDPSLVGGYCESSGCDLLKCPGDAVCVSELSPSKVVALFCYGTPAKDVLPCCP